MNLARSIPIKVTPGAVRINRAWLYYDSPSVKLIELDLHTKYAELLCTSNEPGVYFMVGEHTLFTSEKRAGKSTAVLFPQFPNFRVWSCDIGRYTCSITLHNLY